MAMAWIWTGMIAASVLYGLINGTIGAVGNAAMAGAAAAVDLCLSMAGIMCLWNGVMSIMKARGLMDGPKIGRGHVWTPVPQGARLPDPA